MKRYLKSKDRGDEIRRCVIEGPHVPIRHLVRDVTTQIMGQNEVWVTPPTTVDVDKMHVDDIFFSEMVFGVPPFLFDHIKL